MDKAAFTSQLPAVCEKEKSMERNNIYRFLTER